MQSQEPFMCFCWINKQISEYSTDELWNRNQQINLNPRAYNLNQQTSLNILPMSYGIGGLLYLLAMCLPRLLEPCGTRPRFSGGGFIYHHDIWAVSGLFGAFGPLCFSLSAHARDFAATSMSNRGISRAIARLAADRVFYGIASREGFQQAIAPRSRCFRPRSETLYFVHLTF